MLHGRGAPHGVSADREAVGEWEGFWNAAPVRFAADSLAIARMEVEKLRHDPVEVFTRAVQPLLWLLVFGRVMAKIHAIPTGRLSYIDFLAPGILAQSALFVSIFYGIAVIWERDLGILHKFLVSPASRGALVSGKAVSAGVRALTQGIIVYVAATAIGVHPQMRVEALLGVLVFLLLGSAVFSTFSLIIACVVKTRERFMGIGQILTMPLFFASNAIYPISIMPGWLQALARVNPLSYQTDALRSLMLAHVQSLFGLPTDFGVLAGVLVALVAVASRLYPRVVT